MSQRREEQPWFLIRKPHVVHLCFPLTFRRREWWWDDVQDAAFALGARIDTRESGEVVGVDSKAIRDAIRVELYFDDDSERWTNDSAADGLARIAPLLQGEPTERETRLLDGLDEAVRRHDRVRKPGRVEAPRALRDMRLNPPAAWMPAYRTVQSYLRDAEPELLAEAWSVMQLGLAEQDKRGLSLFLRPSPWPAVDAENE